MRYAVKRKQKNSRMCFACGIDNQHGLHASFYELETNELVALITLSPEHQSYPDRLHGGIAAAILDETIGRAIGIGRNDELWGVTIELTTKFRKPIPLDKKLIVIGRITKENNRSFEGAGEILLENGDIAVSATGRYLKVPLDKITDVNMTATDWLQIDDTDDPREIEIPGR